MVKLKQTADFTGKTIHAGMDVHEANFNISLFHGPQYLRTFQQPAKVDALVTLLKRDYPGAKYVCAYEAGFCGFGIQRELQARGIECLVVHAADIPHTAKRATNKTDRNDSRAIGAALQAGLLKSIYVPSIFTEANRQIIRYRQQVKTDLTRCRNRIKGFLYKMSIPVGVPSNKWSHTFIKWLKEVPVEQQPVRYTLTRLVEQEEKLRAEILLLNTEIRKLLKSEAYLKEGSLLSSIPGIGSITAITLLVEIDQIKRFRSFSQFNSFIGFYPSEFSSGKSERTGRIQVRHHKELRSLLLEAAWVAVRVDPALTLAFSELKKRMTAKRAIIRIARKLTNRIWHVWTKNEMYEKAIAA